MCKRSIFFIGDEKIAHLLVKNGANVFAVNSEHETPLHWASFYGNNKKNLIKI